MLPASLADASLLPTLYHTPPSSGWNMGMRLVTQSMLAGLALPGGPVLEVGCGGGQILADLRAQWPQRAVLGADLHPLALSYAHRRVQRALLVQAALQSLPYAADTFALVLALDLFDQVGVALDAALAESHRVLQPGGLLMVRVSAHPWLFGEHDRAFHTGRRYTLRELVAAMRVQGFVVRRITYANFVLGAPVAVMRLLQRWGLLSWDPGIYEDEFANALIAGALTLEARLLQRMNLPVGLSLWAIGEKSR